LVSDNDTASTCCVGEQDSNKKEDVFQFMNRISTKSIEKVLLTMDGHNVNTLKGYELVPLRNGAEVITDTPHGPFRRIKLAISLTDGEGEAVMPSARVTAGIIFKKAPGDKPGESLVALDLGSLALPTIEHQSKSKRIKEGYLGSYLHDEDQIGIELPESFPNKVWVQLGDKDDGKSIVLQLGFKRLCRGMVPAYDTVLRGYSLCQAFVSQPLKGEMNK